MQNVTFKVGDLGPFEGSLSSTRHPDIYELSFESVQGDETIFRDNRRIQVFRDGDFDLIGKARSVNFQLVVDGSRLSGKIELATN